MSKRVPSDDEEQAIIIANALRVRLTKELADLPDAATAERVAAELRRHMVADPADVERVSKLAALIEDACNETSSGAVAARVKVIIRAKLAPARNAKPYEAADDATDTVAKPGSVPFVPQRSA